jgi:site-specific recombinase XerD
LGFGLRRRAVLCNLPFVNAYRDRHGKKRYYVRRRGLPRVPLKGEPGGPVFLAAYRNAMERQAPPSRGTIPKGTFEALCRDYEGSAEFKQLAATTRREMLYEINRLRKDHGHKPVNLIARKHIQKMKDDLAHKPGACNKMLRTLKALLNHAVLKEYRDDNPAEKVKLMKVGRHRAWFDWELELYERKWPLGTLERFIFDTALYSGQRSADLPKMLRAQIQTDNHLHFKQQKTGKDMALLVHANWADSMAAYLPTHKALTLIAGREGKAIHQFTMASIFRDAKRAAGVPQDCVLHGLRKTTARILAELGMKSTPVTGHVTRAMQDEYERDANQKKMGGAAIRSWQDAIQKTRRPA